MKNGKTERESQDQVTHEKAKTNDIQDVAINPVLAACLWEASLRTSFGRKSSSVACSRLRLSPVRVTIHPEGKL
jgi:hypothetical protein